MKRIVLSLATITGLLLTAPACGRVPKATQTRDSGQSGLMDETFAGKNACNPDNAERPFIIEWDGTDMSSFESYAASDIVLVKYEGCDLKVLDECRNDSIRGSQGAYKPIEWTTGALEKINIANQGELYAKLPLGAATLGGRVAGGEKFSMEYYVSGTRNATRDSVYRQDLAANPGCAGATHFVYGYNLGAFALGSVKDFSAEAGGSAYGFAVGGKTSSNSTADKKGGDLSTCKSDSATEIAGCKAPIRLTLRKVRDGEDPNKAAMKAEDTPESLTAVGEINKRLEMNDAAAAHYSSALTKQGAGDGVGCLKELDAHDKLNPKAQSTDPAAGQSNMRAACLMLSGKCEPGKVLIRKNIEKGPTAAKLTPEQIDSMVSGYAQEYCQGKMDPRDELLRAYATLSEASSQRVAKKPTPKLCADTFATLKRLHPRVKPRDDADHEITSLHMSAIIAMTGGCYYNASDCQNAFNFYRDTIMDDEMKERTKDQDPAFMKNVIQNGFDENHPKCKGKAQ